MPPAKKAEGDKLKCLSGCGFISLFRRTHRCQNHRRSPSASSVTTSAPASPLRPTNVPVATKPPALALAAPVKPRTASKPVPGNATPDGLDSFFFFDFTATKGKDGNATLYGNLGSLRADRSSDKDPRNRGTGNTGAGPEDLKEAGDEEFRKGRFAEALALYERAIAEDPDKASYRSNKAAALAGLGRLLEAVAECEEAVRLDPGYCRAHNRLAGLFFRLGAVEKAIDHYQLAQKEAKASDVSQAEALRSHFGKCSEARWLRDWQTILTESRSAVLLGADLSPQVFAWQAEALMKLHKHSEAELVRRHAPKFDIDASTDIFGAAATGYVLMIQAQVDMISGRFDEAVAAAQKAAELDPSNRETGAVARRARVVASARSKGNNLFNSSRFQQACLAYSEGLDNDPHNAILLCNRAAARARLGQWAKAAEDCSSALRFRPSYTKARLRRAECNSKLKRWQASIQDYEVLIKEIPGDKDLEKELLQARSQLKKKWEFAMDAAHS